MADVRFIQATKVYAGTETPAVQDHPTGRTKVTLAQ
jgi:hypothetical protein